MEKVKKAIRIFKEEGIINFIKRVKMNHAFMKQSEARITSDGIYSLKKNSKNKVIEKNKVAIILSDVHYEDTIIEKKYIDVLNNLGYKVEYYYTTEKYYKKSTILPLSVHKHIKYFKDDSEHLIFINSNLLPLYNFSKAITIKDKTKEEICLELIKNDQVYRKDFYNNISIIILNYNNDNIIQRCIDSLINYNDYNYEIIVIDNQSTDGSYEKLQKEYKNKIFLYKNKKNGCSSGRNLGIKYAAKDYVLFLDSDQWVENHYWLECYLMLYKDNIGAIGWTAGWFNKKGYSGQIVDYFPYRFIPPWGLYRKDIGYLGTGGMFVKKSVLEKVGMFDINYDPTCYEDTDISLKIRHYGLELVYCPYLNVKHLPHQTTKSGTEAHQRLIKEKGDYFVKKWKSINPKLLKYIK